MMAAVCDGVSLGAVVSGEHVLVATRDSAGQLVGHDEGIEQVAARVASVEGGFRQRLVDGVLAAVAHPELVQDLTPALGAPVGAAHLLFVRFLQVIKALSRLSTVDGAGRRTEGVRSGRGADGPLQVARRQPAGDGLERRGGGERQAGHQEQRQAPRGHSAGAVAATAAATGAGSIAAGGRSASPRPSHCTPRAGARYTARTRAPRSPRSCCMLVGGPKPHHITALLCLPAFPGGLLRGNKRTTLTRTIRLRGHGGPPSWERLVAHSPPRPGASCAGRLSLDTDTAAADGHCACSDMHRSAAPNQSRTHRWLAG